jgi:hypothetical protein
LGIKHVPTELLPRIFFCIKPRHDGSGDGTTKIDVDSVGPWQVLRRLKFKKKKTKYRRGAASKLEEVGFFVVRARIGPFTVWRMLAEIPNSEKSRSGGNRHAEFLL